MPQTVAGSDMRRKQSGKNELGLFGASEKGKEKERTGDFCKYQI